MSCTHHYQATEASKRLLILSISKRAESRYSFSPVCFAIYLLLSCSSSISPNISSTISSNETIPLVPPNSSTTTPKLFSAVRKSSSTFGQPLSLAQRAFDEYEISNHHDFETFQKNGYNLLYDRYRHYILLSSSYHFQ